MVGATAAQRATAVLVRGELIVRQQQRAALAPVLAPVLAFVLAPVLAPVLVPWEPQCPRAVLVAVN